MPLQGRPRPYFAEAAAFWADRRVDESPSVLELRTTWGRRERLQSVLLVIFSVVLLAPAPAAAHAQLLRMRPADGAELAAGPVEIDLWFSELLDVGFNSILVFPAAQLGTPQPENHASGPARVDSADRTHLQCPVDTIGPGDWFVQWRVLSRDGHAARGRIAFRVRPVD